MMPFSRSASPWEWLRRPWDRLRGKTGEGGSLASTSTPRGDGWGRGASPVSGREGLRSFMGNRPWERLQAFGVGDRRDLPLNTLTLDSSAAWERLRFGRSWSPCEGVRIP